MSKLPRKAKAPDKPKSVPLAELADGSMPGLTTAAGGLLAEAAAVCLEYREHQSGVRFPRIGMMHEDLCVEWPPVDDKSRRCYADMQETTEWGACGIAILVVKETTGKVVVERSKKGTGFDYWLGDGDSDEPPFMGISRLEVSGILSGTKAQLSARVRDKKDQMKPTDHLAPGFVGVVEFGNPIAHVENK